MKSTSTRGIRARWVGANTKNPELVRGRRDQLIRAAQDVFQDKGFHETTVRDIGRASGLTQGTIYNYVRSKEDILFLVCDRVVAEYVASMQAAIVGSGDPVTRLREALRCIAWVMVKQRSAILLLYHESHNLDGPSLGSLLARVHEWIDLVEDLVADALVGKRPAKARQSLLANVVTFLPALSALRGWALPDDLTTEAYIDGLVDFMMRGLGLNERPRSQSG